MRIGGSSISAHLAIYTIAFDWLIQCDLFWRLTFHLSGHKRSRS